MNFEGSPQKSMKTLKVRKRIKSEKLIQKTKVLKIAKKIKLDEWKTPLPSSIQNDLLLEGCDSPGLYLKNDKESDEGIIKKSNIFKDGLLTPTQIVGPKDNYYKKAEGNRNRVTRNTGKFILPLEKTRIMRNKGIGFDDKMKMIREGIQTTRNLERQEFDKLTPGGKINWLKQTKSLEAYQKQKNYWEKIGLNIADKVHKNPEDLSLNSARTFEMKKKEIEIIDKLQKLNEHREKFYWTQTLRENFYTEPEPPLVLSDEQMTYLNSNMQGNGKVLKYTKDVKNHEKSLRSSDYFKQKANWYHKGVEEINNFFVDNLEIRGKGKLKMEIDAMRRGGIKTCDARTDENEYEDVIEINYSPKVIY